MTETKTAPSPKGKFLLGNALEFKQAPLEFLVNLTKTYGDIARFKLGSKTAFLLSHPDYVQIVLQERVDNYPKGKIWDSFRQISGNGLIASEGTYWRRQRQRVQPAFSHDRLNGYVSVMTQTIREMLDRWSNYAQKGEAFDLCPEFLQMVSLLAARSLFGVDESGDTELTADFMYNLQTALASKIRSAFPTPLFIPTPNNLKIKSAKQRFDRVADRIIAYHREHNTDRGDLLSAMMSAQDEETGETMSNSQLRDEVMTLFVAGHETSARLLPFIFYLLAKSPDIEQKLLAEIQTVVGNRIPTFTEILQLKYTKQIFDEALRLYPPIYFIFREAVAADTIAGYEIPQDAVIFVSPYITHRHSQFWQNSEDFQPDRFAVGESATKRHKFAYFPFGGGPHTCIGPNFAALEVMLTLVMILQRYQVKLLSHESIELDSLLILSIRDGVKVSLRSRVE